MMIRPVIITSARLAVVPILLLVSAGAASATSAAEDQQGVGDASQTRTLTARLMSLTYTAPVDPVLVHSHETKMRWSSVRHRRGFDPSDPSHSLAEEEDESLRPTLCRTLTRRLGREVFAGLAERLPGEEGRRVMAWRGEAEARTMAVGTGGEWSDSDAAEGEVVDMRDLEPVCRFAEGKEKRYSDSSASSSSESVARQKMIDEQSREIEQTCTVRFGSLLPYYGIGFDMSFTLSERPMKGLSPDEMRAKLTPDRRGWTQPVRTTEASIKLTVQSPDHGGSGVGLGNAPKHLMEEALKRRARASNAERAVDKLVMRADAVLNVINMGGGGGDDGGRTMEKTNLGSKKVTLRDMPTHPSMLKEGGDGGGGSGPDGKADKDEDVIVPPHVQQICKEHGLDEAKCKRAYEIMREDMKKEEEAAEAEAEPELEQEPEPEPEPESEEQVQEGKLRTQTDEELEAEMDAWMAAEAEREAAEAAEVEMADRERKEREAREEAKERERELDEMVRRREEQANDQVDDMLAKIEEAERRSEEMRRRAAEGNDEGSGGEACKSDDGDGNGGAPECPGDGGGGSDGGGEQKPLPSPPVEESKPPHPGPPDDVARDEL